MGVYYSFILIYLFLFTGRCVLRACSGGQFALNRCRDASLNRKRSIYLPLTHHFLVLLNLPDVLFHACLLFHPWLLLAALCASSSTQHTPLLAGARARLKDGF